MDEVSLKLSTQQARVATEKNQDPNSHGCTRRNSQQRDEYSEGACVILWELLFSSMACRQNPSGPKKTERKPRQAIAEGRELRWELQKGSLPCASVQWRESRRGLSLVVVIMRIDRAPVTVIEN